VLASAVVMSDMTKSGSELTQQVQRGARIFFV